MVLKSVRRIGIAAALLLLLANPADLSSCGPFFPSAIFTRSRGPDNEQAFFHGHFGILQGTYDRRYLAMAYRILSGEPPSDMQVASVSNLDRYRSVDAYREVHSETFASPRFNPRVIYFGRPVSDVGQTIKDWLDARDGVSSAVPIEIDPYRQSNAYAFYLACNGDAFVTARRTLLDLIRQAGPNSAEVRDWLAAQDDVFANCSGAGAIPDPAPPGSSERIRANRAYQIAAAYFYSGKYDEAREAFLQIAADSQSQWRVLAPYLVARTFLRQANYAAAEQQLSAILADPNQSTIHRQSRLLLDYARAKLDPGAQLLALSQRLMQPSPPDLGHDLSDYTFIFEHFNALNALPARDDLTNWIVYFQASGVRDRPDYVQLWRSTKSLPWLLLAIPSANEKSMDVIDAGRAVPADSPAYATARFETARWLIAAGRRDEAAAMLDDVLKQAHGPNPLDTSSLNAFRAERMRVAKNFDEFLAYAPRTLAAELGDPYVGLQPPTEENAQPLTMFDSDAANTFNLSLPIALWLRAAQNRDLAGTLRTELAQCGWVRSILLDRDGLAFARSLAELKPAYATGLQPYVTASGAATRTFEAVFFILHHPEMSPYISSGLPRRTPDAKIDQFRDNWWGPATPGLPYSPNFGKAVELPAQNFLTASERTEVNQQQRQLLANAGAPSFLSSIVVAWVKAHPADDRNAEALALAVKTSRFSPGDTSSSDSVRQAFRLLHQRYPNSDWARRTPYWYK